MNKWRVALIGAIAGPLIGIPLLMIASVPQTHPIIYPVTWLMIFLSRILFPDSDMAGLILFMPLLGLYCAFIGALVALAVRFVGRKFLT
jgi:hypothetical protein